MEKEGIHYLKADPEYAMIQEGHTEENYRDRGASRQHSRSPARRPRVASRQR